MKFLLNFLFIFTLSLPALADENRLGLLQFITPQGVNNTHLVQADDFYFYTLQCHFNIWTQRSLMKFMPVSFSSLHQNPNKTKVFYLDDCEKTREQLFRTLITKESQVAVVLIKNDEGKLISFEEIDLTSSDKEELKANKAKHLLESINLD